MGTCIYDKYQPNFNFNGKKVLNLGCGLAKYNFPNVVNIDAYDICKPNIVWDLEKTPLPFGDCSFDLILANHIFEHLHNWWNCFEDCARILKDDGTIEVYVPGSGSDSQLGYRDHVSIINQNSFYGTFSSQRPASNAWAAANGNSNALQLKLIFSAAVLPRSIILKYMPKFMVDFCIEHLRNIIVENRFIFRKMSLEEYNNKRGVLWQRQK